VADEQELQLVVSLVDEATPGLLKLKGALQETANAGMEKFKRDVEDIEKKSKSVGEHTGRIVGGINEASKSLAKFASQVSGLPIAEFAKVSGEATRGAGGFAVALGSIPPIIYELNESVKEFADRMSSLDTKAKALALPAGQFKELTKQIHDMGLETERAEDMANNLLTALSRMRPGQANYINIFGSGGQKVFENPQFVADQMERIRRLSPAEQIKESIKFLQETERKALANPQGMTPTEIADRMNKIARQLFGIGSDWRDIAEQISTLKDATQKQIDETKRTVDAAKTYNEQMKKLQTAMEETTDKFKALAAGPLTALNKILEDHIKDNPWAGAALAMAPVIKNLGELAFEIALGIGAWKLLRGKIPVALPGTPATPAPGVPPTGGPPVPPGLGLPWISGLFGAFIPSIFNKTPQGHDWLESLRRRGGTGRHPQFGPWPPADFVPPPGTMPEPAAPAEPIPPPTVQELNQRPRGYGGRQQIYRFSGGEFAGGRTAGGGGIDEWLSRMDDPGARGQIEDRRKLTERQNVLVDENTEQLKRLNDWLLEHEGGLGGGAGKGGFGRGGVGAGGGGGGGGGGGAGGGPGGAFAPGGEFGPAAGPQGGGGGRGPGGAFAPGGEFGPAAGPAKPESSSERESGQSLYNKLLAKFRANPPKGVPPDAAQFGITKGTPEEWARFGVSVAHAESGFNPNTKNLSDRGGSFGVFQYAHNQVPGGNAYNTDASIDAFVRDANSSAASGSLRRGMLGQRFSTIGRHPDRGAAWLGNAARYGEGGSGLAAQAGLGDIGKTGPGAMKAATGLPPQAFIFHHTSGRGTIEGVQETLQQRRLGVEYAMDREGNIRQIGGPGSRHMLTGWGAGAGLSNANTVGMEVIAKNDRDVTAAQVKAAQAFIAQNYPNTPVFGHGQVNPGHKEADEGMTIVNAIKQARQGHGGGGGLFGGAADRSSLDRSALSRNAAAMTHRVHGTGKLDVNVNAPPNTQVKAEAGGIFRQLNLNRQTQMGLARGGPMAPAQGIMT
jgi:uncharacterized protein YoxC